ncbi:MAG: hypothetical protein KDD69_04115 [Bdellovibrionales bacterium]|nr:hypothetical protein [Bdellovibrionales bacterium]
MATPTLGFHSISTWIPLTRVLSFVAALVYNERCDRPFGDEPDFRKRWAFLQAALRKIRYSEGPELVFPQDRVDSLKRVLAIAASRGGKVLRVHNPCSRCTIAEEALDDALAHRDTDGVRSLLTRACYYQTARRFYEFAQSLPALPINSLDTAACECINQMQERLGEVLGSAERLTHSAVSLSGEDVIGHSNDFWQLLDELEIPRDCRDPYLDWSWTGKANVSRDAVFLLEGYIPPTSEFPF